MRIRPETDFRFLQGLILPSLRDQKLRVPVMGVGIAWVQFEGAPILVFRTARFAVIELDPLSLGSNPRTCAA